MDITPSAADRFWSYVDRGDSSACWEWRAARMRQYTGKDGKPRGAVGYGFFGLRGKNVMAHRVAYELSAGPIPEGMFILHKCDNPPCVNPNHLAVGSASDNTRDMISKGRASIWQVPAERRARGERHGSRTHPERLKRGDEHPSRLHPETVRRGDGHGMSKLTEDDVRAIRAAVASGDTHTEVAIRYGVSKGAISCVWRRVTWRHVDAEAA